MPGLLRGIARTAIVAGTATAVSNRVSMRQAGRWAADEQRAAAYTVAPEPTGSATDQKLDQLRRLGELRAQGVLTEAEFEAQKQRLLR